MVPTLRRLRVTPSLPTLGRRYGSSSFRRGLRLGSTYFSSTSSGGCTCVSMSMILYPFFMSAPPCLGCPPLHTNVCLFCLCRHGLSFHQCYSLSLSRALA